MFEIIETLVQLIVIVASLAHSLIFAINKKNNLWTLLSFFYGSYALGVSYCLICIVFLGAPPAISVLSDFSWYTTYLFLFLMFRYAFAKHGYVEAVSKKPIYFVIPSIGPLFSAVMAAYYMRFGSVVSNVIYALLMGMLLYGLIYVFINFKVVKNRNFRTLCYVTLLFCFAEYGMWTASCIFEGNTIANPYYWFDMLLTINFPIFIPIIRKEAAA